MEEQGKDMWSRSMGRLHTKSEIKDGSLQWHEFCQGKEILYNLHVPFEDEVGYIRFPENLVY